MNARGAAGPGLHGLFRLGESLMALPIDAIREVTPRPATLIGFPAARDDVLGAIDLRGSVIPVMDLARTLGLPPVPGAVILVLRTGGGVVGLLVDEICGVIDLAAEALSPLAVPADAADVARPIAAGFVHQGRSGALLDPVGFAALPGLAVTVDHPVDRAAHAERGAPTLLIDCGGKPLGLATSAVEATVPVSPLLPPAAETPLWLGMLDYNGRRIPVADTLLLLGLGMLERRAAFASVVLRLPEGRLVALAIDEVCDMRRLQDDDVLPLQAFRIGEPGRLRGIYKAERAHLLLDEEAVTADERLQALSLIEEKAAIAARIGADAPAATRKAEPFLIMALGQSTCAAPLAQVAEIIPAPAERIDLVGPGPAAIIAHRGRGVPLMDLAQCLGLESDGTHRFVVMVESEGDTMGFQIDALVAVERVFLQNLARGGDNVRVPAATVRLPDGRTCAVVDLAGIIAQERIAPPVAA